MGRLYKVSFWLPTRTTEEHSKSIVQYEATEGKILLSPKWHKEESDTWVIDTPVKERIPLTGFEHLLLGVNMLSYIKNPLNMSPRKKQPSDFKDDLIHALTIAVKEGIFIAHYYLALAIEFYEGSTAAAVKSHYQEALRVHQAEDFVTEFNKHVPMLKYLTDTELKSYDKVQLAIDSANQFPSLSNTALFHQAEDTKENTVRGIYLAALAERYTKDSRAAIQYYLAAACFGSRDGEKFIKQLPDLSDYLVFVKQKVGDADKPLKTQMRFINCFAALYDFYQYLHSNKLKQTLPNDQKQQQLRQRCFMNDLCKLYDKKIADINALTSHVDTTGEELGLVATDYSVVLGKFFGSNLFKGSQTFQNLRLNLIDVARINTFDQLLAATDCFMACLHSQADVADTFAQTLLFTATKLEDYTPYVPSVPSANLVIEEDASDLSL